MRAAVAAPVRVRSGRRRSGIHTSRVPRWLRRRRNQALIALFAVTALIAGTVLFAAARIGAITHQSPLSVLHDVVTGGGDSNVGQAVAGNKPITIALYGYGGEGHDGAYLSDSIMVVVIQPHADGPAQIAEISIPRDWYVPIDLGNGSVVDQRINTAYAFADDAIYPQRADKYKGEFGRPTLADDTLSRLLGIHIDHFIGMDFKAFEYAVDAVGGVDVTVAHSFTDHEYPNDQCDFQQNGCASITVHFDAGLQHMDGRTALRFARSRKGDNGEGLDFARSQRQQLVLAAVRARVSGVGGITKVFSVLSALQGHVLTDFTAGDGDQLYKLVKDVPQSSIEHIGIDNTNFLYDCGYPTNCGAYYLYAHDGTFASIKQFVTHAIPDRAALAEKAPITVVDASGRGQGAAERWAQLLHEQGFNAVDGGTAPPVAASSVTTTGDAAGSTAAWLASYFGTAPPAAAAVPSTTAATGSASSTAPPATAVRLVLGRDEERAFNRGGLPGDGSTTCPGCSGAGDGPNGAVATAPPRPRSTAVATAAPTARPAPAPTATPVPPPPGPTTPTPKPTKPPKSPPPTPVP